MPASFRPSSGAIGALVLCVMWLWHPGSASAASFDDRRLREVIATAVDGPRTIVLAVWTGGSDQPWRLRRIDLVIDAAAGPVSEVVLSRWSTKALARTSNGGLFLLDLTERADALAPERALDLNAVRRQITVGADAARRRVHTQETFAVVHAGRGYVVDQDLIVVREYDAARAIAIRLDEAVVIVTTGGDVRRDEGGAVVSTCTVPAGHDVTIVSGGTEGDDGVMVLSTGQGTTAGELRCLRDPETAKGLLELPMSALALSAASGLWPVTPEDRDGIANAAAALDAAVPGREWRYQTARLNVHLYTPILEFATQERVFPSSAEIWNDLWPVIANAPRDKTLREQRLFAAYQRLQREERCTIYSRVTSYPGTWLLQYWLYSPFDIGGRGPHLHDSEHLFVEVDKLGGMVRRVLGSGHGGFAGNNLYDAEKDGAGLTLPLFAMVELGKHATAPDTDGDGFFVPGVDENYYNERAKVWGIRDVIGSMKNELISYDATMTIPRRPEGRMAVTAFAAHFDASLVPQGRQSCRIEPFPKTDERCPRGGVKQATNGASLVACGIKELEEHPDAVDPRRIFKPTAFPPVFVRASVTVHGPWNGVLAGPPFRRVVTELGMDTDRIVGVRRLSLPGRIVGGIGVRILRAPVLAPNLEGGSVLESGDNPLLPMTTKLVARSTVSLGYEQFAANLFGFFASVAQEPNLSDLSGFTFKLGPLIEFPVLWGQNLTFRPTLSARPADGSSRFEMTVSIGGMPLRAPRFGR